MHILITGGAGFIGSNAARFYAENPENRVYILDNLSRASLLNKSDLNQQKHLEQLLNRYPNISFYKIDIRDYNSLNNAFLKIKESGGIDGILHTAGQTAVTTSLNFPIDDFTNNTAGTVNVLECMRKHFDDSRLIFCSTNKVYGDRVNNIPITEKHDRYEVKDPKFNGINEMFPIDNSMHTPYGCSKLAADLYVQDYNSCYSLNTVVFRQSCIYGPHQMSAEDQGWVDFLIRKYLRGDKITIFGNGKQVRDILHVDDLVNLYSAYFSAPSEVLHKLERDNILCVGGGYNNTISILELLSILKERMHELNSPVTPSITYSDWRNGDQLVYYSDISKARALFGWEPLVSAMKGIKRQIELNLSGI